jgi:enoyl-CoA hydratase
MTVTVEKRDQITIITIDRPDVRNAIDQPTAEALFAAFSAFDREPDQNVAILTGANDTFCAGADLKAVADGRGNKVRETGPGPVGPSRMQLGKPVIAAIEGHAVAGGLELAVWCDLRVAAEDAVFGVYCRRWGVPLVDGGTIRLPRLIGHSHAMDLILTGRGVSGEEARMMGLANRLCAPGKALSTAEALAREISRFPQRCMRSDRLSSYQQWHLSPHEALLNETRLGLEVIRSGETREGASRFSAGAGRHGDFENIQQD